MQKIEGLRWKSRPQGWFLTQTGRMLYRRAVALLGKHPNSSVQRASFPRDGSREIGLAVGDPVSHLPPLLDRSGGFGTESLRHPVEIVESVISGTSEAPTKGTVDLAITPRIPPGFLGTPLTRLRMPLSPAPITPCTD